MRELKFRAWWTHPESESRGFDYFEIEEGWKQSDPCQDLLVVEQFTGLRDKNGREIYEGDVVRFMMAHNSMIAIGKVTYVDYIASFMLSAMNGEPWHSREFGLPSIDLEIIGNIHEHPELIGNQDPNNP